VGARGLDIDQRRGRLRSAETPSISPPQSSSPHERDDAFHQVLSSDDQQRDDDRDDYTDSERESSSDYESDDADDALSCSPSPRRTPSVSPSLSPSPQRGENHDDGGNLDDLESPDSGSGAEGLEGAPAGRDETPPTPGAERRYLTNEYREAEEEFKVHILGEVLIHTYYLNSEKVTFSLILMRLCYLSYNGLFIFAFVLLLCY
jgi:hypothetical protein